MSSSTGAWSASQSASQLANQLLATTLVYGQQLLATTLVSGQQLATPDQPGPELVVSFKSPAPVITRAAGFEGTQTG